MASTLSLPMLWKSSRLPITEAFITGSPFKVANGLVADFLADTLGLETGLVAFALVTRDLAGAAFFFGAAFLAAAGLAAAFAAGLAFGLAGAFAFGAALGAALAAGAAGAVSAAVLAAAAWLAAARKPRCRTGGPCGTLQGISQETATSRGRQRNKT